MSTDKPRRGATWRPTLRPPIFMRVLEVLIGVGIAGAIMLYLQRDASRAAHQAMCNSNIHQIMGALENYHREFGCFPPSSVNDASGRPMHSWRILMLRYYDPKLYAAYNFNEPWNGPNNRKLASLRPSLYGCPSRPHRSQTKTKTNFVLIVGPGTLFHPGQTTSPADIPDGPANTIVLVEIADSGIDWLEPRDLDLRTMSLDVNDREHPSISSNDPTGPAVAFANWKVWRLKEGRIRRETLHALFTRDGGEPVDKEELIQHHSLVYE